MVVAENLSTPNNWPTIRIPTLFYTLVYISLRGLALNLKMEVLVLLAWYSFGGQTNS